jgi:hypothetical protein
MSRMCVYLSSSSQFFSVDHSHKLIMTFSPPTLYFPPISDYPVHSVHPTLNFTVLSKFLVNIVLVWHFLPKTSPFLFWCNFEEFDSSFTLCSLCTLYTEHPVHNSTKIVPRHSRSLRCLLWIEKVRVKDKIYEWNWSSVRWETKI